MMNEASLSSIPRLVIGAPQGRSGKTTVCLAITLGLVRRGFNVRCFKKGPDFIDPSWLREASGRDCFNLDGFMMSKETVKAVFAKRSTGSDIALVEGAMGLFDGHGEESAFTVADAARLIGAPIILVVNATRMTQSAAAMVAGYQGFEPDTPIAGVILNNVSGERHRGKLTSAIEKHCRIPVLGAIPKSSRLAITERHLGLVPSVEESKAAAVLETVGEVTDSHIDFEGLLAVAKTAYPFRVDESGVEETKAPRCTIGVIRDRAFSFYYPENLEALRKEGAELVFLDSLVDRLLPPLDGLYIGGGFPELYGAELQRNVSFRRCPLVGHRKGLARLCRVRRSHVPVQSYLMAGDLL